MRKLHLANPDVTMLGMQGVTCIRCGTSLWGTDEHHTTSISAWENADDGYMPCTDTLEKAMGIPSTEAQAKLLIALGKSMLNTGTELANVASNTIKGDDLVKGYLMQDGFSDEEAEELIDSQFFCDWTMNMVPDRMMDKESVPCKGESHADTLSYWDFHKVSIISRLSKEGHAIKEIKDPTFEMCLAAVSSAGMSLYNIDVEQFDENQIREIEHAAVSNNGRALILVTRLTKDIIYTAIMQNHMSFRDINKSDIELLETQDTVRITVEKELPEYPQD